MQTARRAPDSVERDGGPKPHLVRIAKLTFDRRLTDAAGGNLSMRHDDRALVTPRYAGSRYQWDLAVEQICEVDFEGNLLAGAGETSREISVHLAAYRHFPEIGAVIHAHPFHVQGFVYAGRIDPTHERVHRQVRGDWLRGGGCCVPHRRLWRIRCRRYRRPA